MAIQFNRSKPVSIPRIKTTNARYFNAETRPYKKYRDNAIKRALQNYNARKQNLDIQNNAATKIQSVYRGHKVRKDFAQNQDDILRATLDKWVNEAPNECDVRQRVKDRIEIINGQLVVEGKLDLNSTNISSLPQGLHVRGDLNLFRCTGLKTLPQGLTVEGNLSLQQCTRLTELPQDLHVGGDLDLDECTSLTTLHQGLHVGGHLDLSACTSLTELPEDLHIRDDLYLIGCTNLETLPQSLTVERDLWLNDCTSLETLPQGLHVGRDLYIDGCTSLTSLPDWVFELRANQTVYAQNTGIPARLLADYNTRQNAPGYNGPQINFSINDYRPTSDINASQLPNLVRTITQTDANHPFWKFAATQTELGSLFNSFALFLTRLLNEFPQGNKRQTDLAQLRQKLTPLFRKMEAEYDLKNQDIGQCDFIINHILSAALTATGTCIDKVKVGYLFMQLFVKDNFQQDLTTMDTIIKTVEDIASARIVFDASTNQFIHVAKTILDGDFDDTLKRQAKYLLKQTDDSSIQLTDGEMTLLEDNGSFSMDTNTLTQLLYSAIVAKNPQITAIRIGDQVEDILNLAYKLLGDDFHKIDMRWDCCCTLKNSSEPAGPQYETAAKTYIQQQLLQHNAATAIQKHIRGFLVRRNNQQPSDSNN